MMDFGFNNNSVVAGDSTNKNSILIGRVTKVIMGEYTKDGKIDPDFAVQGGWGALGSIKFNLFQQTSNPHGETKSENFAKPLFANIKQYPLINEIVAIIAGPSYKMNDIASAQEFYYVSAYNLWNSQHHNAFPDLLTYAQHVNKATTSEDKTKGAKESEGNANIKMSLGAYFKEQPDVRPLRPFEGDIIIEGRWGQSIRFGSTSKQQKNSNRWSNAGTDGDPITIITNKRSKDPKVTKAWIPAIEDINKDGSSIWLSSGQSINIDVSKYPLDTFRLGFLATFTPNTILPLKDLSPGIQNIASAEYDKRVLNNIGDVQNSTTSFGGGGGITSDATNGASTSDKLDLSGLGIDIPGRETATGDYNYNNEEPPTSGGSTQRKPIDAGGSSPAVTEPVDNPSAGSGEGGQGRIARGEEQDTNFYEN